MCLIAFSASAEIHILSEPKKEESSNANGWSVGQNTRPVISVPGSVQKPRPFTQERELAAANNRASETSSVPVIGEPSPTADFNNQVDVDDEALFDGGGQYADGDVIPDGAETGFTGEPVNNLSKIQRRERAIQNRARRDILNLDLKDDSRSVRTIKATKGKQGCNQFTYEPGLLKSNLEILLESCGYSVGQWEFGDAEYEYDFPVKKSYTVGAKNMIEMLEQVKQTYLVGYKVNHLDKTVDFRPSRGDRLQDMELKHR